ncbi:MAG: hypothetical protein C0624_01620 [Desulfuromonas sp.]|nr:MAG: hypothetical protein C0624_01620 [Desulfuromonas sp.]
MDTETSDKPTHDTDAPDTPKAAESSDTTPSPAPETSASDTSDSAPQETRNDTPAASETTPESAAETAAPEKPVESEAQVRIVAIKFRDAGKLYDFDARGFGLDNGTQVVVETDRGRALGTVVLTPRETPRAKTPDGLKGVLRIATDKDLESAQRHATREAEALRFCRQRVGERNMEMKLVRAEYLFDGSKIIFYFTADGRVDFRELVKDLAHHFHTRIEMRQIGVRDEAKLIGGIGVCGRELCCCSFLREFEPVSVKMAKEQGLALNPSKISGQCGRLLCCLGYEYETYCSLKKGLPKCGRKVKLEDETVEVTQIDVLRQQVTIRHADNETEVVTADEIRAAKLEQPSQGGGTQKAESTDKGEKNDRAQKGERRDRGPRNRPSRPNRRKQESGEGGKSEAGKPESKEQQSTTETPGKRPERDQGQTPPADGERKKRRRPRRRRKKKPGGQGEGANPGGQGPSKPDNNS